ncbi:MAG: TerB N-terminal domain-containing protein [Psittacicella sp.]
MNSYEHFRKIALIRATKKLNTESNIKSNSKIQWISSNASPFKINSKIISGGFFYISTSNTTNFPAINLELTTGKQEFNFSNPNNPIKFDDKLKVIERYPTYNQLRAEQRAFYLDFLNTNRLDKRVHIGYLFMYFYNLEYYILEAKKSDISYEVENIYQEVLKLYEFYPNLSFKKYTFNLLALITKLWPQKFKIQDINTLIEHSKDSLLRNNINLEEQFYIYFNFINSKVAFITFKNIFDFFLLTRNLDLSDKKKNELENTFNDTMKQIYGDKLKMPTSLKRSFKYKAAFKENYQIPFNNNTENGYYQTYFNILEKPIKILEDLLTQKPAKSSNKDIKTKQNLENIFNKDYFNQITEFSINTLIKDKIIKDSSELSKLFLDLKNNNFIVNPNIDQLHLKINTNTYNFKFKLQSSKNSSIEEEMHDFSTAFYIEFIKIFFSYKCLYNLNQVTKENKDLLYQVIYKDSLSSKNINSLEDLIDMLCLNKADFDFNTDNFSGSNEFNGFLKKHGYKTEDFFYENSFNKIIVFISSIYKFINNSDIENNIITNLKNLFFNLSSKTNKTDRIFYANEKIKEIRHILKQEKEKDSGETKNISKDHYNYSELDLNVLYKDLVNFTKNLQKSINQNIENSSKILDLISQSKTIDNSIASIARTLATDIKLYEPGIYNLTDKLINNLDKAIKAENNTTPIPQKYIESNDRLAIETNKKIQKEEILSGQDLIEQKNTEQNNLQSIELSIENISKPNHKDIEDKVKNKLVNNQIQEDISLQSLQSNLSKNNSSKKDNLLRVLQNLQEIQEQFISEEELINILRKNNIKKGFNSSRVALNSLFQQISKSEDPLFNIISTDNTNKNIYLINIELKSLNLGN